MRNTALTLMTVLALLGAREASAQTDTEGATASITIPTLISIDVSNATVGFDQPTLADYTTGHIGMNSGASVVSTRSNIIHKVTIQADAATMTGPSAKPASDLQWGTGGAAGSFAGLTTTAADVVGNLPRGNNATAASVWYRMVLDEANDQPGTYSLAFTYTALAN